MIKGRTKYDEAKRTYSEPGSRYEKEYELVVDKQGRESLREVGETDIQEMIDSFESEVNLHNLIERFKNGDESALEKAKGWYADISELPVKLQDIMNLNLRGKEFFDSLPIDVKKELGDNYQEFMLNPEKLVEVIANKEKQKIDNNIDAIVKENEVKEDIKEANSND